MSEILRHDWPMIVVYAALFGGPLLPALIILAAPVFGSVTRGVWPRPRAGAGPARARP